MSTLQLQYKKILLAYHIFWLRLIWGAWVTFELEPPSLGLATSLVGGRKLLLPIDKASRR